MVFSDARHSGPWPSLNKASAALRLRPATLALQLSLAGLIALTPPAAVQAQQGNQAAQEVQQLLQRGDKAQARKLIDQSLATDGRNPQLRFLRGLMLSESGDTKQAIEVFTQLTQDFPDMAEPYNNLAVLYADQGLDEKALVALTKAVSINPNYTTAYENMAELHARLAQEAARKAQKTPGAPTPTPAVVASAPIAPSPTSAPVAVAAAPTVAATPLPAPRSGAPTSLPVMALPVELTSVNQVFGNGNAQNPAPATTVALGSTPNTMDSTTPGAPLSAWDTVTLSTQQPQPQPQLTAAAPAPLPEPVQTPEPAVVAQAPEPITAPLPAPTPAPAPMPALTLAAVSPAPQAEPPTTIAYNNGAVLVRRAPVQAPASVAPTPALAPAPAIAAPAVAEAPAAPAVLLAQAPSPIITPKAEPPAPATKPTARRPADTTAARQSVSPIPATLLSEPDAALVTAVVLADAQMPAAPSPATASDAPVMLAMAAPAPSISDAAAVPTWLTPPGNPSTTPLLLAALPPQETSAPAQPPKPTTPAVTPAKSTPTAAPVPVATLATTKADTTTPITVEATPPAAVAPVPTAPAATSVEPAIVATPAPASPAVAVPQSTPAPAVAVPEPQTPPVPQAVAAAVPPSGKPAATATPAAPTVPMVFDETSVHTAVQTLLQAWNTRDADTYLATYVPDFTPDTQGSHEAWQQKVRDQLTSPRPRQLEISGLTIDLPPATTTAVVRFRESNVAGVLKVTKLKRLDLVQRDGQWRIASESSAQ
ncbi:MAG: Photosystem I assembly protein Ycf3 [Paracidovorax wautersii]|uniref:Photosystem I assembly protein Ycf3 n=1 Tax=Paracidovorax wautersii TaxID=1177982 RepID=A0A7V8FNK3_9BURK|nr:MAG: Photosystem I assembly protein Ycf3 [Paracidovorax wautersii]